MDGLRQCQQQTMMFNYKFDITKKVSSTILKSFLKSTGFIFAASGRDRIFSQTLLEFRLFFQTSLYFITYCAMLNSDL